MDSSTSGERIQDVDEVQLVVELLVGGGVGLEQGGRGDSGPGGRLRGTQVASAQVILITFIWNL